MDTWVASAFGLPNNSMKIGVQLSVPVPEFNSSGLAVELPDHMVILILIFFRNHNTVFHNSMLFFVHHFTFPLALHKDSNFSTSLLALVSFWGFNFLIVVILSSLKACMLLNKKLWIISVIHHLDPMFIIFKIPWILVVAINLIFALKYRTLFPGWDQRLQNLLKLCSILVNRSLFLSMFFTVKAILQDLQAW